MVASLQGRVGTGTKEDESSTGRVWDAGFHHVTARSRLARFFILMDRLFNFPNVFRAAANRGYGGPPVFLDSHIDRQLVTKPVQPPAFIIILDSLDTRPLNPQYAYRLFSKGAVLRGNIKTFPESLISEKHKTLHLSCIFFKVVPLCNYTLLPMTVKVLETSL